MTRYTAFIKNGAVELVSNLTVGPEMESWQPYFDAVSSGDMHETPVAALESLLKRVKDEENAASDDYIGAIRRTNTAMKALREARSHAED